ncbi:MAG: hypothetical protein JJV88_02905 [Sulfurovum sp.]|nr:hypothetical protein [Sulfurovaceae bacterium]
MNYNTNIIEVFIATPKKFDWYKKAFNYFEVNLNARWYWNSGAFIGGFWYLLFRKDLKSALMILFIELILGAVLSLKIFLLIFLLISILIGGFGTFFIYRKYKKDRAGIEAMFQDTAKRIGVISIIGGVNPIAYYAGIFSMLSLLLILIGLLMITLQSTP